MANRPSAEQRREFGAFLSSRRARLLPKEFGLPDGQRRTPGLRREEVAVLAGVSVSWYTWLEQGRDVQPSPDALRRIAKVLRLDRVESAHLYALSALDAPAADSGGGVSAGLDMLVRAINPIPAYVRNTRLDILAGTTPSPTCSSITARCSRTSATRCACCSSTSPIAR